MKIFISILLITIITAFSKFSFAQVNSYTVSGYVYNFNDILIKDASYFNRLDTIKQRKYENNKRIAEMANNYYKEKDYESALFYAKDISFTEYYHFQNIKCFLKVCSNARLGKKWETINAYDDAKDKADPVTMRLIKQECIDSNIDIEKIKKETAKTQNRGCLTAGIGGGIVGLLLLILLANSE
jgi:hypothetical protein